MIGGRISCNNLVVIKIVIDSLRTFRYISFFIVAVYFIGLFYIAVEFCATINVNDVISTLAYVMNKLCINHGSRESN